MQSMYGQNHPITGHRVTGTQSIYGQDHLIPATETQGHGTSTAEPDHEPQDPRVTETRERRGMEVLLMAVIHEGFTRR